MVAIAFDTLKINKSLKSRGFTEEQAEALTEMAQEAICASIGGYDPPEMENFATKTDVASLRTEMAEMKAELIKWMFGGFLTVVSLLVAILLKVG